MIDEETEKMERLCRPIDHGKIRAEKALRDALKFAEEEGIREGTRAYFFVMVAALTIAKAAIPERDSDMLRYSLTLLALLAAGCSMPDRDTSRAIPSPPAEEREGCEEYRGYHGFNIPGLPARRYFEIGYFPTQLCLVLPEEVLNHTGAIYLIDVEWQLADWDLLEWAEIYLDGEKIAWVYDGTPGWDPNYDFSPYAQHAIREDGVEVACIDVKLSSGFWTPRSKTRVEVTGTYEACPPKE